MTRTGAPWTWPLPAHWRTQPMFTVGQESTTKNSRGSEQNLLSLSFGRIVRKDINTADGLLPASFETYQIVEPDDVVFRFTDLQNDKRSLRSARVVERGIITSAYLAFTPTGIDPRFFEYLMRGYDVSKVFYGMGGGLRQSLKYDDVRRMPVLVPPLSEQHAITDYLDRETAQIDELIEKQTTLIDRLRERRDAVIVGAITAGVREASFQDSGIYWSPTIPSEWRAAPLKRLLRSVQTGVWGTDEDGGDDDIPCVRVADFDRSRLSVGTPPTMRSVSSRDRAKCGLRRHDILIEKSGGTAINPVGFVVSYQSDVAAVCANFIARLRTRPDQYPRYWLYALNGSYVSGLTWRSVKQTTGIQNLDMDAFLAETFPVPPLEEQREIAAHIDQETSTIDELIAKTERFIELTRERRSALITAAVTGQVDVTAKESV